jgi:hypothetical protein
MTNVVDTSVVDTNVVDINATPIILATPKRVFIVPYRDRINDKALFLENMKNLLADTETYEIYFAHQYDARPFNRGAMKNIGFLAMKQKYPDTYGNITFIFHDVDTWPCSKGLIDYNTIPGIVKHYYGFRFALGGIFAIKGADFMKTGGFPNFWGWGMEDNAINDRCLAAGLKIDRSCFYQVNDKRIVRSFDGFKRVISKQDILIYKQAAYDNMQSLKNVNWQFQNEYINISSFDCLMKPADQIYEAIDIRNTKKLIVPRASEFRRKWNMFNK